MRMKMKILVLLLVPTWVLGSASFPAPVQVNFDPPVSDPVLPTEKDPVFDRNSSDNVPSTPVFKVVHHPDLNKKVLIALVVSSSLLGGILLLLSCFSIYRLKKLKRSNQESGPAKSNSFSPISEKFSYLEAGGEKNSISAIDYQLLAAATNNFNEANIIGESGSGRVYKAHFSADYSASVKKISGDGQEADQVFENELKWLTRLEHQNIVTLLGYCLHGEARYLVYEMMENGSLEFHLHGAFRRLSLSWYLRMKIALDVARGLEYLHERCDPLVIHRNLRSSNILLDSNFNAKISDFRLAITGGNSDNSTIKLSGRAGYVAPEYFLNGKLTDKSDVYAFGIVLLELLIGKKPVQKEVAPQCQSLVEWATPQLTDRSKLPNMVDPAIRNTMDLKHLYQVAAIAALCVQPEPSYRPLITDVLHSFIPLVPTDLGGSLRITDSAPPTCA